MLLYVKNNRPHFAYNKEGYKLYINKTIDYFSHSNI